jgi:hypothetical protein
MVSNSIPIVSYGIPTVAGVGLGARARCDDRREPLQQGRPRCDILGKWCRPRCELWAINRVHLDRAFVRVCYGVCIYSVCVDGEYFNYACRHLPTPNFFAQYSTAKPYCTVQKMPNHPKSAHRGHTIAYFAPPNPWVRHCAGSSCVHFGTPACITH